MIYLISPSQFSCHFATLTPHSLRLWCGPGGPAAEPRSLAALYRCPQEANSHTISTAGLTHLRLSRTLQDSPGLSCHSSTKSISAKLATSQRWWRIIQDYHTPSQHVYFIKYTYVHIYIHVSYSTCLIYRGRWCALRWFVCGHLVTIWALPFVLSFAFVCVCTYQ